MRKVLVCVATLFFGCGDDGNTIRIDAEDVTVSTPEDTPVSATIPVEANRAVNVRTTGGPSHGTVSSQGVAAGTIWTYTPEPNFNGTDAIMFEISGASESDVATLTINVTPVNDPPVAEPDSFAAGFAEDLSITTTALLTNDTDPDSPATALVVTAVESGPHGTVTMTGSQIVFTPEKGFQGASSFKYTLSDGDKTAEGDVAVTIGTNNPPVAVNDTQTTPEDTALTITAASLLANDTDADGNTLMLASVDSPTHGTVTMTGTSITFTPEANYNGPATFEYIVVDGAGQDTGTVNITVTPTNDAPTAMPDVLTALEDVPRTIPGSELTLNDTDPDGDVLTVTAVSSPVNGTVAVAAGVVTFTPTMDFTGLCSFTYTVSDGTATASSTVTITIAGSGDPPVAVDDTINTTEDNAITVTGASLVANDLDPDGSTLTVTSVSGATSGSVSLSNGMVTFTPTANFTGAAGFDYVVSGGGQNDTGHVVVNVSPVNDAPVVADDLVSTYEDLPVTVNVLANDIDIEGTTLTVMSFTQPQHGTSSAVAGGIQYVPDLNFFGSDTFTYVATDGSSTSTATVTITVVSVNDAPIAVVDFITTNEDTSITTNVRANDTDVDLDTLGLISVTQPMHGTAQIIAGNVRYTPSANYFGQDMYTYTIGDGHGATAVGVVMVTVLPVPDPAIAVADTYQMVDAGGTLVVDAADGVMANDLNIEGGEIVEIDNFPNGFLDMNDDGSFEYEVNDYCDRFDSFTYEILDGPNTSNTVTVNININHVPEVSDQFYSIGSNMTLSTPGPGFFGFYYGVIEFADEFDDDEMTVGLVSPPSHALSFSIDPNGDFTYTPASGFSGNDQFTFTVSDGIGPPVTRVAFINVIDCSGPSACTSEPTQPTFDPAFADALLQDFQDTMYGKQQCCYNKLQAPPGTIAGGGCDFWFDHRSSADVPNDATTWY